MTAQHVAELIERRDQLGAQIAADQARVRSLVHAVRRLDHTICAFERTAALRRPAPTLVAACRGEMRRELLDILATAERPLSPREIAVAMLARRGSEATSAAIYVLKYRVRCALSRCQRAGLAELVGQSGRSKLYARLHFAHHGRQAPRSNGMDEPLK